MPEPESVRRKAGRPRIDPRKRRDRVLKIRLSAEEGERLLRLVDRQRRLSTTIRELVLRASEGRAGN